MGIPHPPIRQSRLKGRGSARDASRHPGVLGWLGNSSTPTNISLHRRGRRALAAGSCYAGHSLAACDARGQRVKPAHSKGWDTAPPPLPPQESSQSPQPLPNLSQNNLAADLTASSGLQQQLDHFNTRGEESLGFSCQQQDRKWQLVKSHALEHCQV